MNFKCSPVLPCSIGLAWYLVHNTLFRFLFWDGLRRRSSDAHFQEKSHIESKVLQLRPYLQNTQFAALIKLRIGRISKQLSLKGLSKAYLSKLRRPGDIHSTCSFTHSKKLLAVLVSENVSLYTVQLVLMIRTTSQATASTKLSTWLDPYAPGRCITRTLFRIYFDRDCRYVDLARSSSPRRMRRSE